MIAANRKGLPIIGMEPYIKMNLHRSFVLAKGKQNKAFLVLMKELPRHSSLVFVFMFCPPIFAKIITHGRSKKINRYLLAVIFYIKRRICLFVYVSWRLTFCSHPVCLFLFGKSAGYYLSCSKYI